jgi:transcriptional regulator with XRE-family HTH domain
MPVVDAKSKGPDPIDSHVGNKIRRRRGQLGMSQEALAHALGLTFQQVQKYERGTNRVSASRLWRLAAALDAPITFFFEGLAGGERPAPTPSRYESAVLRGLARMPKETRSAFIALATMWAGKV